MVEIRSDIDFNMVVHIEIDDTVSIKFAALCSNLRKLGFLGRPISYMLTSLNSKGILYYPLFANEATILYIELVEFDGYVKCNTIEFLDAIMHCDCLSIETKKTIEVEFRKYFFKCDDSNVAGLALSKPYNSADWNITYETLFKFYIDDEVFWRPCFSAINEVSKKLTISATKSKLANDELVIDKASGVHMPCIISRGSEKYLCGIWINCFYYNIPVFTITCECISSLDSVLTKFLGDKDYLYSYAMTQPSEMTFYYKDFKFSKNDIYYINTLIVKKDLFKSIFESDNYKIERFL